MQTVIPVDVIVTFNTKGEMKPNYIRLEDDDHMLRTYQIQNIYGRKEEHYAGFPVYCFDCSIKKDGLEKRIMLRYVADSHIWQIFQK